MMAQQAVESAPPGLQEATKNSTYAWQENLTELFRHAKDRFPDVVWEVGVDENECLKDAADLQVEEVWGHKAIVYARAPPSFQTRYFSFRQQLAAFPDDTAAGAGDYPDESESITPRTPSPSPSTATLATGATATTPTPQPLTTTTSLLRLTSSINSALFSNELEYLYTGKGFGEAFEFLFDSSESRDHSSGAGEAGYEDDPEALRIDKLRKDLVFMWRSRLYSDVRIALTGNFSSSTPHENTTAIFSSHRFILVSRSSYFHQALLSWPKLQQGSDSASSEPPIINLPSPPFTPASLHFTLGFMYTGTLIFSHRSYDLSTAFAILRAALYLDLPSLQDEIQARIVQEMLHGLFHAFISFNEYDRLTGGKWGTGGCRCRQCARRVPRVLEFAIADDVKNLHLERGARRALVGIFGEGWCNQEFASLPLKTREIALKGLGKRTTPPNVFPLLFAAEHALGKLGVVIEPWGDVSGEMILSARKMIDDVLCKESEACFNSDEWMELMEADGVRFEDGEKVQWAMAAVLRGVKDTHAASLYQTLVSSILLRPHPTDVNAPLLPATSHVRVQVEQTRLELLKWIGKRWLAIRQERGFDPLEGWALKEISDHIEVPIEDLLNPPPQNPNSKKNSPKRQQQTTTSLLRPTSHHPHTSKVDAESDMASSMRVSVLSRSIPIRQTPSTTTSFRDRDRDRDNGLASSASSVRSAVRSSADSYVSAMSGNTAGAMRHSHSNGGLSPAKMIVRDTRASGVRGVNSGRRVELKDRPDSKLTPSLTNSFVGSPSPSLMQPSIVEPDVVEEDEEGQDGDGDGDADQMVEGEDGDERESQYDDDDEHSRNGDDPSEDSRSHHTLSSLSTAPRPIKKILITRASLASSRSSITSLSESGSGSGSISTRPKSSASSVRSQDTVRKSLGSNNSGTSPRTRLASSTTKPTTSSNSRPTRTQRISTTASGNVRPTSSLSSATDSTATFRTASTGLRSSPTARSPRPSGASGISIRGRSNANSPVSERTRRISGASVSSVASNAGSLRSVNGGKTVVGKKPVTVTGGSVDSKKLGVAGGGVSRPTSVHSAVSGGSTSTASNSTSKKVVRKVVGRKVSGEVEQSQSSLSSVEASVKESEVGADTEAEAEAEVVKEDTEKDEKQMDVDVDVKEEKEDEKAPVAEDIVVDEDDELPLPNTSSTMTIKPKDRPFAEPIPVTETINMGGEHKKSSSSASAASVATLKRKGSSDTIKTVKSTPPPPPAAAAAIIVDIPPTKQLPPTPSSQSPSPSPSPLLPPPEQQQQQQQQLPRQPPPPLQHQTSMLKEPTCKTLNAVPQGATLEIGIPCIIASKRKRFKAYARYIGEVEGEIGAWVGVEVPMPFGDSLASSTGSGNGGGGGGGPSADDRQWNDGSWGGIRYFEIGGMGGSEWDYGGGGTNEDRASRRRRTDGGFGFGGNAGNGSVGSVIGGGVGSGSAIWGNGGGGKGMLKREGDQFSIASASEMRRKKVRSVSPAVSDMSGVESRGLFVRPQQVLYVVDAVGADL